ALAARSSFSSAIAARTLFSASRNLASSSRICLFTVINLLHGFLSRKSKGAASQQFQFQRQQLQSALTLRIRVPPFCLGCRLGRVVVVRHHQQLRRVPETREVHFLAVDDQGSIAQGSRDRPAFLNFVSEALFDGLLGGHPGLDVHHAPDLVGVQARLFLVRRHH